MNAGSQKLLSALSQDTRKSGCPLAPYGRLMA